MSEKTFTILTCLYPYLVLCEWIQIFQKGGLILADGGDQRCHTSRIGQDIILHRHFGDEDPFKERERERINTHMYVGLVNKWSTNACFLQMIYV